MIPVYDHFFDTLANSLHIEKNYEIALEIFKNIQPHEEKVRFSLELMNQRSLLLCHTLVISKKDDVQAAEMRKVGNRYFAQDDYVPAMEHYNKSLCLAEKGSENMGIAYANRSAVYFRAGYYNICLENIELALKNGYPDKLENKIMERKQDCLIKIRDRCGKKLTPNKIDVKLSFKPDPKIPLMVEGIELKKNEKYGNHFVAKKNFDPGNVLMVEKPIVESLFKKKVYMYCLNCKKNNLMNLRPCEESTYAMFCSQVCYEECLSKFFKYEGPILDSIYEHLREKLSVIRTVFKMVTIFGNLDNLKEAIDSRDLENINANEIDYLNSTEKDYLLSY